MISVLTYIDDCKGILHRETENINKERAVDVHHSALIQLLAPKEDAQNDCHNLIGLVSYESSRDNQSSTYNSLCKSNRSEQRFTLSDKGGTPSECLVLRQTADLVVRSGLCGHLDKSRLTFLLNHGMQLAKVVADSVNVRTTSLLFSWNDGQFLHVKVGRIAKKELLIKGALYKSLSKY